jgi:hypothetical protein
MKFVMTTGLIISQMKNSVLVLICVLLSIIAFGQQDQRLIVRAQIIEGDTIPLIDLPQVIIFPKKVFASKREARQWDKLVKNVKKVYPYAKLAGMKFRLCELLMQNAETDKQRRGYLKQAEKEIKENYGDELKKLNFTQGKILLKLVDRETGNTSYVLLQELRGKLMAFFWQGLARVFGYNLKEPYDPTGKDRDIEQIVVMIENGAL